MLITNLSSSAGSYAMPRMQIDGSKTGQLSSWPNAAPGRISLAHPTSTIWPAYSRVRSTSRTSGIMKFEQTLFGANAYPSALGLYQEMIALSWMRSKLLALGRTTEPYPRSPLNTLFSHHL